MLLAPWGFSAFSVDAAGSIVGPVLLLAQERLFLCYWVEVRLTVAFKALVTTRP